MILAITLAVLPLAALPALMTVANLRLLRRPGLPDDAPSLAILIPARDEATSIAACLDAALRSVRVNIEIVVLDDSSSDRTREIVEDYARRDRRVRVAPAPPLPPGWNGKQHACHVLSTLTEQPLLLFIDADVRLEPEGAARLAAALEHAQVDLVSGVPRQIMVGLAERMLIPMINALILGYLPVARMRRDTAPALAAGCGQLMMVRRAAYHAAGGHAAIRRTLHDGLKLPRLFRRCGLRTDLVDGTDLAACRMYAGPSALVQGLLKNATEGMAKPLALPVWTVLLFGGHVLPSILLCLAVFSGVREAIALAAAATLLPLGARLLQAIRCKEPIGGVLLHVPGMLALLAIQWAALLRSLLGLKTEWRGRVYEAEA